MKKIFSVLLVLWMLLTASAALAEGMDVQVIGEPETATETVSLDDLRVNAVSEIGSEAMVQPTSFGFVDVLGYYTQGGGYNSAYGWSEGHNSYRSGAEADYAVLKVDITNLSVLPKNFLSQCQVKVVFDDVYEYAGWSYQYNYDYNPVDWDKKWGGKANKECVIQKAEEFEILPMYAGHYCFGCTLPNAVVNSKAPLKMIITIDGTEMTYNIRN